MWFQTSDLKGFRAVLFDVSSSPTEGLRVATTLHPGQRVRVGYLGLLNGDIPKTELSFTAKIAAKDASLRTWRMVLGEKDALEAVAEYNSGQNSQRTFKAEAVE